MKDILTFINESLNQGTIGSEYRFEHIDGLTINSIKRIYPCFDKSYIKNNVKTGDIQIDDNDNDESIKAKKIGKLIETWPIDLLQSVDSSKIVKWGTKVEQNVVDNLPGLIRPENFEVYYRIEDNGDLWINIKSIVGTGWNISYLYTRI